jgi:S-adenosylmethionine hydrolase
VRPTFHGRDWFAPFLVRQASGPARLKTLTEPQGREFPACRPQGDGWQGEIIAVDHFGNLVTSIPAESSGAEGRLAGLRESLPSAPNYVSIPAHRAALIAGSHGFWEIACYQASAAEKLGVGPRTPVTVFPQRPTAD